MKIIIFAVLISGFLIGCSSQSEQKNEFPPLELLVGTYTGQGSDGIYLMHFDLNEGGLENKGLVAETTNPSYLARSKDFKRVFAVNETESGGVSSFKWNQDRTKLELLSQQPSEGDYPCYASLNDQETLFVIGNYMTGNMVAYDIDSEGVIQSDPYIGQHQGTGANPERQEGPHAHCVVFSNNNKFLYAVDLGIDEVVKYAVNDQAVSLPSTALKLEPGDGPRHLIFHPTRPVAYIINELSSTVVGVRIDPVSGNMTTFAKVSTLPDEYEGENSCADIHISADGRFVYASNRGHNSIAVISTANGGLTRINNEPVRGDWPRNFTLSPDSQNSYLLVANQKSNNITIFKRHEETGLLMFAEKEVAISQPVCLKF